MYKYQLIFRFKAGDLFSNIRDIEDKVNGYMADFGFDEKMFLEATEPLVDLRVSRILSGEEETKIIDVYNRNLAEAKLTCVGMKYCGWEWTKDREDEGVDAYQEAYDSCPGSNSWENPYKPGTEAHAKWNEGWHWGHAHTGP